MRCLIAEQGNLALMMTWIPVKGQVATCLVKGKVAKRFCLVKGQGVDLARGLLLLLMLRHLICLVKGVEGDLERLPSKFFINKIAFNEVAFLSF